LYKTVKIGNRGQITIPREVRRVLGVGPGDRLMFEGDHAEIRVRGVRTESPFAKYRGIGNPGIPSGRVAINQWIREVRGR
jgi:AbrB family looped-hinge helix DNA binding protein